MPQAMTFGPPVISVDVEDWPQSTWDRTLPITDRAARNTRMMAELLEETGVRATMFVLGKFAERFPTLVRELHERGHEIASHGYGHVEIFRQSPRQFSDDVRRSKELLEDIIGERVKGYRAPDFSVMARNLWALDVLAEAGFDYDSSIFPIDHPRYGIPGWPAAPVRVRLPNDRTLVEIPIATLPFIGKAWPVGGGGYQRLLPGFVFRYLARSVMAATPFVLYCHPYELDPAEFREISIRIPLKVRLHQGLGRSRIARRLKAFLSCFGGRRMEDVIGSSNWPAFDAAPLRSGRSRDM